MRRAASGFSFCTFLTAPGSYFYYGFSALIPGGISLFFFIISTQFTGFGQVSFFLLGRTELDWRETRQRGQGTKRTGGQGFWEGDGYTLSSNGTVSTTGSGGLGR
jgi:hypothetical protein